MVEGIPYIRIKTSAEAAYTKPSHDKRWATVIETTKGPINEPTFIESKLHAKQIFGFNADPFFDNGGTGLILVRAGSDYIVYTKDENNKTIEDPNKTVKATTGTANIVGSASYTIGEMVKEGDQEVLKGVPKTIGAADLITLETTYKGSCPVRIDFSTDIRGEFKIVVKSLVYGNEAEFVNGIYDNCTTDVVTIQSAPTLAKIVDKINKKCYAIKATLTENGALFDKLLFTKPTGATTPAAVGEITTIDDKVLKAVDVVNGIMQGTNGVWDADKKRIPNKVDETDSDKSYMGRKAHESALRKLENERLGGVFCVYPEWDIQNKYAQHSEKMSADDVCRWRYACIGANNDDRATDIYDLLYRAEVFDSKYIIFIGQGLIDYDGNEVLPYEATMYWAGLRSNLSYGTSMFGGDPSKILYSWSKIEGKNEPVADVMPLLATENEVQFEPEVYANLNEAGVVTTKREYDTVTFREGVTTSQANDYSSEESVVNIVKYALNVTYDVCYGYQGKNITANLKTSLEEAIKAKLSDMKTYDGTLTDVATDNLKAYDVEVMITPRAEQKVGKIYVNLKITPVYALRQIEASVIVQ